MVTGVSTWWVTCAGRQVCTRHRAAQTRCLGGPGKVTEAGPEPQGKQTLCGTWEEASTAGGWPGEDMGGFQAGRVTPDVSSSPPRAGEGGSTGWGGAGFLSPALCRGLGQASVGCDPRGSSAGVIGSAGALASPAWPGAPESTGSACRGPHVFLHLHPGVGDLGFRKGSDVPKTHSQ